MITLMFFGAALVCLIAAPFCRSEPTDQELDDDEHLKSLLLLPGIFVSMVALFFKARNIDGPAPRKSAFPILVCLSIAFMIAGLLANGLTSSGSHK
jgi:hypothetical protein